MSKVAFLNTEPNKSSVFKTTKRAMELGNWKKYVKGKNIVLKINAVSAQLVPGQNTSPWVFESVLKEVVKKFPKANISVVDANTNIARVKIAKNLWGYEEICEKYGARFRDLTDDKLIEVKIDGKAIKKLPLPETLLNADSIITLPVMKTHGITGITCSMKNQYGCIPIFRHQFHLVIHDILVDINKFLNPVFTVVDGTICQEGAGPRNGKAKICNVIMASNDLVATDYTACKFMGLNPEKIGFIMNGDERGLGSVKNIEIIGDEFIPNKFELPKRDLVLITEDFFRRSFLKPIMFDTKFFDFLLFLTSVYSSYYRYNFYGKKYRNGVLKTGYREEFMPLLKKMIRG